MSLYDHIQRRVNVTNLVNDMVLLIGGYQEWSVLVGTHFRGSGADLAEAELSAVVSYWRGQADAEDDENLKILIWQRAQTFWFNAMLGAERGVLNESEFYEALGIDPPGGGGR